MSNEQPHGGGGAGETKFFFFVDGKKFDWPQATITGAEVRAAIPGLNPTFQIFIEGHGGQGDHAIGPSETFSLDRHGQGELQFYTAPPATFGAE